MKLFCAGGRFDQTCLADLCGMLFHILGFARPNQVGRLITKGRSAFAGGPSSLPVPVNGVSLPSRSGRGLGYSSASLSKAARR